MFNFLLRVRVVLSFTLIFAGCQKEIIEGNYSIIAERHMRVNVRNILHRALNEVGYVPIRTL